MPLHVLEQLHGQMQVAQLVVEEPFPQCPQPPIGFLADAGFVVPDFGGFVQDQLLQRYRPAALHKLLCTAVAAMAACPAATLIWFRPAATSPAA